MSVVVLPAFLLALPREFLLSSLLDYRPFKHGGGNLGIARPLTAPLPGVCAILLQPVRVRLYDLAAAQKQQPDGGRGHSADKGVGIVKRRPKPRHNCRRVEGLARV